METLKKLTYQAGVTTHEDVLNNINSNADTANANFDSLEKNKQNNLTFDNTPTDGSNNPVTSGGVKSYVDGKVKTINDLIAEGYLFAGIATPSTNTITPKGKVFYLCIPGTYSEFEDKKIEIGELGILYNSGENWKIETIPVSEDVRDITSTIGENPGYIRNSSVVESESYNYSNPILLKKGETIQIKAFASAVNVISKTDANASYYQKLVFNNLNEEKEYRYTAEENMYVAVCWKNTNEHTVLIINYLLNDLSELYDYVLGNKENIQDITNTSGKNPGYISPKGAIAENENYNYSDPIRLKKGETIRVSAVSDSTSVIAISNLFGGYYSLLVRGDSSLSKDYTYTAEENMYVAVCWRNTSEHTITITKHIDNLSENVTNNSENISKLSDYVVGSSEDITEKITDEIGINQGYIDKNGAVQTSDSYLYTNPISLKKNQTIKVKAYSSMASVISITDADASYYKMLVYNTENAVKDYSYTALSDMYVSVSFRKNQIISIIVDTAPSDDFANYIKKISEQTDPITPSINIAPNLSIKCFKELNYTDGSVPMSSMVLWVDDDDNYYYSRNIYSERIKIFTFDQAISSGDKSGMYSAFIMPNGDVLFVYRTEFSGASTTEETADSVRKNPIIYQASNNYTPIVIDFGDNVKPSGWLQNCGVLYSYEHNCLILCEYTRGDQYKARVWKAVGDITDYNNWSIVLEHDIVHPYGTGFKHFHTVQLDNYTGIIYVTSGDDNTSSIVWYSKDGGGTFTQLDDPNRGKYRMLNMAFTKGAIYWASDDWYPNHKMWKAERDDDGILNKDSITELYAWEQEETTLYDRIATYASIYMPMINCILILNRDDEGNNSSLPVNVYDISNNNMVLVDRLNKAEDGLYGFRFEAVTRNPRDNKVIVSFGQKYENNIALLGNKWNGNQINNIVISLNRIGDTINITYDTIY